MVKSIYQFLCDIEKKYPEKVAYRFIRDGITNEITFAEYVKDVRTFAGELVKKYGDVTGYHIGVLGNSSYELIVCYMGVLLANATAVIFNIHEDWEKLENEIKDADIRIILSDNEECKYDESIKSLGDIFVCDYHMFLYSDSEYVRVNEELEDVDRIVMLLFTSGTTSKSKAVMISWRNILAMMSYNERRVLELKKDMGIDILPVFLSVPLYHVAGLNIPFFFNYIGETVNICSNPKYILKELYLMKSVYTMAPPIVLNEFYKLLCRGKSDKLGDLKCIICGGASYDSDMEKVFRENGIKLLTAYGLTETMGIGCMSKITGNNDVKSVGFSDTEAMVSIIDGEICFKGDAVSGGYYMNDEATKAAFDDNGWFHSGDLGYLDSEGNLFLTGRKKNLIILESGENVVPEELEALILKNKLVKDCIVKEIECRIGVEIYCEPEHKDCIREYIDEVNRNVAMYKRITKIIFRDGQFEKTSTGKIKRG